MAITIGPGQEIFIPEQSLLQPRVVGLAYGRVDTIPRDDVLRMIELYPKWQKENLDSQTLGLLTWYFNQDPKHISYQLTNQGRQRDLLHVAKQYETLKPTSLERIWDRVKDIEEMIALLEKGQSLPPIIVVRGSRYPDSPESSFIDGVHRGLAEMVYSLRFPSHSKKFPALVGQKAGLGQRLLKKFAN